MGFDLNVCSSTCDIRASHSCWIYRRFSKNQQKNSKGLAGKYKLLGQLITTAVVLFILLGPLSETLTGIIRENPTGSEIKMRELLGSFFKDPILIGIPIILVFVFWVTLTGSSNAINLTDGLDGLAIGCTVW